MSKIANIKRILWEKTSSSNVRWYGITTSLMLDDKNDSGSIPIGKPVNAKNHCGLTEIGRKIINKILRMKGVRFIWVRAYEISVEIVPAFRWNDGFHEAIITLLNQNLFNGEANIVGPEDQKAA